MTAKQTCVSLRQRPTGLIAFYVTPESLNCVSVVFNSRTITLLSCCQSKTYRRQNALKTEPQIWTHCLDWINKKTKKKWPAERKSIFEWPEAYQMLSSVAYSFDFPIFAIKQLHHLFARKPIITRSTNTNTINQWVLESGWTSPARTDQGPQL